MNFSEEQPATATTNQNPFSGLSEERKDDIKNQHQVQTIHAASYLFILYNTWFSQTNQGVHFKFQVNWMWILQVLSVIIFEIRRWLILSLILAKIKKLNKFYYDKIINSINNDRNIPPLWNWTYFSKVQLKLHI